MIALRQEWLLVLMASGLAAATARAEPAATVPPVAAPAVAGCCDCNASCERRPLDVTLGFRTWFTWAGSQDTILFSDGTPSTFRFRNLDATVYEFNVDAVLRERFVARVDSGFGLMPGGQFQTEVPTTSTPPSDLGNDLLYYVTADVGCRVFQRGGATPGERSCAVDGFVGYQHWHESYVINDLTTGTFYDNHYHWDSVRLGLRGKAAAGRWAAQARAAYVPWTHFSNPSANTTSTGGDFKISADGGQGVMADASVSCRLGRGLSLEVGYQVFHIVADSGTFRDSGGPLPFTNAETTRHGVLVGLQYRF